MKRFYFMSEYPLITLNELKEKNYLIILKQYKFEINNSEKEKFISIFSSVLNIDHNLQIGDHILDNIYGKRKDSISISSIKDELDSFLNNFFAISNLLWEKVNKDNKFNVKKFRMDVMFKFKSILSILLLELNIINFKETIFEDIVYFSEYVYRHDPIVTV